MMQKEGILLCTLFAWREREPLLHRVGLAGAQSSKLKS